MLFRMANNTVGASEFTKAVGVVMTQHQAAALVH